MSDSIRIDFTGVEGQKTLEPLPNGKYLVEVTDFKEGEASSNAKNPGAPTISWEFTVVETLAGDVETTNRSGETIKVEGRKVWENMTIVEASFWRLKALLQAAGFAADGEIDFDPAEVVGSQVIAQLGTQPKSKNKVTGDEYPARNKISAFFEIESDSDSDSDSE